MYASPYISTIENTLNMLGYGNFWFNQDNINLSYSSFKLKIKRRLQDQYVQNWKANINNDELYYNYRMFKDTFSLENYLVVLTENYAKKMFKFRTLNHRLPIQSGRFRGITRGERTCTKCETPDIGDEFHYIFCCPFFAEARKLYVKPYYWRHSNTITFEQLLTTKSKKALNNLCKFITIIMESF